jgi:hypothetical protein
VAESFVSTEARILQQPHFPSSDFENFFSTSTACASDQLQASRQREANSTAFETAVNHLVYRFPSPRSNHQQGFNHHPVSPAHSTQLSLHCNLSF